jgi:hypothetical protein
LSLGRTMGILPKPKIVPLALIVLFLSPSVTAQTLDEVLRPLLNKGQWRLSLDLKDYGYENNDFSEGTTYYDSRAVLFPGWAFGLTRNLQLTISGVYQFPKEYSWPRFGELNYWSENRSIRSLSGQLLFRPAANIELSLFLLHGRAREDTHDGFRLAGVDRHITDISADNILIVRGTWLSAVDGENRPIRADLDGLRGPLLKKGRWRVDPEILIRGHDYESRVRYDSSSDYLNVNSDSIDKRLRLAASYGLSDHLEAKADGYWQPSFRINESRRSRSTRWDGMVLDLESEANYLYFNYWGGRGSLVWRPSPRIELNLALNRNWLKLKTGLEQKQIIQRIDLAAAWLSKPKLPGIPLAADLAGIYHPLLENKQSSLDLRVCYHSSRKTGRYVMSFEKSWLFRLQAAYGLSNSLQASAYYGIDTSKRSFYDSYSTFGGELTLRQIKRTELFAAVNFKPKTYLDEYPPFMLDYGYRDFLSVNFGEDFNIELGCRLIF